MNTVKPQIKDTSKEDKPLNKGQAVSTLVYTLYRKLPRAERGQRTSLQRTKRLVPKVSLSRGSTVQVEIFKGFIFQEVDW